MMGYSARMVTVLRAQGLRVVIYVNDHDPAHVHVFGDGEAKINLLGAGGSPELIWADGMSRGGIRRALRIVTDEQTALLARWEEIHGRTD
jgi:hypothetical protein